MRRQRKPIAIQQPARARGLQSVPEPRPKRINLVHRATDSLSKEAWAILQRGFRANKSYAAIAAELAAFGEPVAERTVARRAAEWRADQRRRLTTQALNQELLASGLWRAEELIALIDQAADIRPGWMMRRKRVIARLLRRFCANPNRELLRAVEASLFTFWLSFAVEKTPVDSCPRTEPTKNK